MASMTQDHILRKDTRGRVVVTAERRGDLLAQFDQSGVSGVQFAKLTRSQPGCQEALHAPLTNLVKVDRMIALFG